MTMPLPDPESLLCAEEDVLLLLTRTAKLKLILSPAEKAQLREASLAYRDGLNHASRTAFEAGKTSNKRRIQKLCYAELRETYGLPAQLSVSVCRQVGASYQALWTKAKNNAAHRKRGWTKRRYRGLDQPPKFTSRTLTYNYGRDWGFKAGQHVSIQTLQGRLVVPYLGWSEHLARLSLAGRPLEEGGVRLGEAKLFYERRTKEYYLLVSFAVQLARPRPEEIATTAGADLGQRYLLVATDTDNQTMVISGAQVRHTAERYARTRTSLQSKGTRSAKRRLQSLAKREKRFRSDVSHRVANQLLERYPGALIGLEDLSGVRERTGRRRRKKASKKQRRANRQQSGWSYADLRQKVAYKAPLAGSVLVACDADYTSQQCVECTHRSKANRPGAGLLFRCEECGFELHADLLGGRNVTMRTLLIRHDWMRTGRLSTVPDVTTEEAKAERLKRYSELRWRSVTSPDHTRDSGLVAGR
jgi:IS605 OrfB family transposase